MTTELINILAPHCHQGMTWLYLPAVQSLLLPLAADQFLRSNASEQQEIVRHAIAEILCQ